MVGNEDDREITNKRNGHEIQMNVHLEIAKESPNAMHSNLKDHSRTTPFLHVSLLSEINESERKERLFRLYRQRGTKFRRTE